jgi:hypothetical protein
MNLKTIDIKRLTQIKYYVINLSNKNTSINSIIGLVKWKFNEKIYKDEIELIVKKGI